MHLLLRWKLTANPLVTPKRRRQIAKQLQDFGTTFPVQRALAARAADEGDWVTAARLYTRIADDHPEDRSARATALYAQSKAQGGLSVNEGERP